ncbi:hypothetical protein HZQ44_16060 [Elizabethkingia anophelis]|nr:hypothetical protein [Elizabethkingia anophelis]MCT3696715.1 hypothetical protein [Elizabethkingia anophelis]MCT3860669.1 hypothetical protein [Elizabethkingia anophelis]MCT3913974.1 hypothetical protein [Elizabethkingia anophelis]MCT4313002.1 hypothetical protein [Elizabethkingia anophelis]
MNARSQTPALTRAIIESERPSSAEKTKTSGTANKTNSKYNSKAEIYGKVGTGLLVVGAVSSAYNIAESDTPGKQAVKESSAWTGAVMGGETGGTIGSALGPGGALVGGILGSIAGGTFGSTAVYTPCNDCVTNDKNKPVLDGGLKSIQEQQAKKIKLNNQD